MPEISPLIRLFVSSTFADFTFEREVLQRAVFPKLRALCAAQGCRFQPIDLRWGVSEEAGNEKRTLAICLDDIARCQRLSPDLNFLILLGDRYGSCFLPEHIPSDQVARLLLHLAPAERDAFAQAYKEDLNALRPEYVLLPSDGTGDARQAEELLRAALAQAAQAAGFSEQELLPFVASATHLEIQRGLLDAGCDPSATICAIRSFDSMQDGSQVAQFVEQDQGRRAQLEALREAVERRLDGRVYRYGAPGQITGPCMGQAVRTHYKALAEQFYALLEPRIQDALALRQVAAQSRDPSAEANRQFAESRASMVVGRENALDTVATYLAGRTPLPLVVTGDSGVGKSTLLARVVVDAARKHSNAVIVTRYIGVTPGTSSLADLISGLHREIAERYNQPTPEPFGELSQLVAAFANQLGTLEAPVERPLLLVVDALDQLSAQPQRVDWLPGTLAAHVRVVLSTLSDRQELMNLRTWLPEKQILRLDPLNRAQGADMLHAWLAAEGRRLTSEQESVVLNGFAPAPEGQGTPLYLRLAFEQARTWRSFDRVNPLPTTAASLIQTYFSDLEDPSRHGRELVAYALGDLAAAKYGMAEDELLDVLSRSAAVREALQHLSQDHP